MKHVLILLPVLLILSVVQSSGQDFEELEFGTDATFEVATWNIEWFPKAGQTTVDYVSQIIEALDVDLIAMQELDDTDAFDQMMDGLADHVGYYESGWFAGLAYIYNPDAIVINDIYEIYTTEPSWNTFPRSPMVMDLSFEGENIIVINNHYKCCGDGVLDYGNTSDEEYRRYLANALLKAYIDAYLPDDKVILLGDLNDMLTDDASDNVFQMLLDDTENYLFADLEIEQGSSADWSYPSWPSHLDHILITNDLVDALNNDGSAVATIRIDEHFPGGWYNYDNKVSDHRPVAMRLDFEGSVSVNTPVPERFGLTSFPNPFNPKTVISYALPEEGFVNLSIFDSRGREIDVLVDTKMAGGQHSVEWDARHHPSGLYFTKLTNNGSTRTHKMMLLK
ncbi:MAG: T9SS type A sorting domain-containing protein [bacterium]|nr:T9SS type A sorting domain-containing protein [bacterium]